MGEVGGLTTEKKSTDCKGRSKKKTTVRTEETEDKKEGAKKPQTPHQTPTKKTTHQPKTKKPPKTYTEEKL